MKKSRIVKEKNESNVWWENAPIEVKALFSGISTQVASDDDYRLLFWEKIAQYDRNNIYQYWQYQNGLTKLSEDEANSLQIEVICELAEVRLENLYSISREKMYNKSGAFYEKYQDRFNDEYDDIEDRLLNHDFINE